MPRALRRVPPVRRWTHVAALAMAGAAPRSPRRRRRLGSPGVARRSPPPTTRSPTDPGTIVGVKGSGDVASVTRVLKLAGLRVQALPRIDALFLPRVSTDPVRRLLSRDARVRWIEPTRPRALLVDPSSSIDGTTGRPYDWAYSPPGRRAGDRRGRWRVRGEGCGG